MLPGMYKRLNGLLVALVLILPMGTGYASAAQPKPPPPLPDSVAAVVKGPSPHLLGYGRMRWWFWSAFDASLWITGNSWNWNEPFVLELRYVRDFDGSEIVEGTRDQWGHLGYTNHAQLKAWLEELSGIFPNVKAGDQLAGVYLPGRETHFFHNGQPIGTVANPDFGKAFFSIWLDEKTSQPVLRQALLGGECAQPTEVAEAEEAPCSGGTMRTPSSRRPGPGRS